MIGPIVHMSRGSILSKKDECMLRKEKRKAERIAKSEAARVRRRSLKDTITSVTVRMYSKLRKKRRSK
jgi:hypothetical protein